MNSVPGARALPLVLALATVLVALPAAAAEVDDEVCLTCHGAEGFTGEDGRPLTVAGAAYEASAHAAFPCTGCHDDATVVPHEARPKALGIEVCATCHGESVDAYREGVHGQAAGRGVPEAPSCSACHGDVHAVRPHTEPASAAHWSHLAARCARCHANVELAERLRIPIVRPVEAYLASVHARAVARGEHGAVCSDCHGSHAIRRPDDPRGTLWRATIPATCGSCHAEILATYRESVHGEALARGASGAAVCTDCHGEHRILERTEPTSPVYAANLPVETCGRCHGDRRLSEKYGLSMTQVSAFQDSYHGLALRAGQLTVANCSSCHGIHDIRPSSDPRSHVHRSNLPRTCGKCHPGAGERFALGAVHVVSSSPGAPLVYWVRRVYVWLIAVTIAFMALHNGLDLARKARRPPAALPPPSGGAQPERMPRPLRWQHGLVMLSFPTLVYTGFALVYPESWWATPLVRWETTLGLRGVIHRCAAVVLLAALAWHAGHLAASARLRACLGALLPSWRDVRALGRALAISLGRRAAPLHGGTFGYVEKLEYWAFVWGMVIMTASGVLLWFENATLRWLPKWVTDVATAVHFYEAVLATLAILVWHLYWVIFDPDVYPMDWSWWDGRSPAARARERTVEGSAQPDRQDGGDGPTG